MVSYHSIRNLKTEIGAMSGVLLLQMFTLHLYCGLEKPLSAQVSIDHCVGD